MKHGHGIEYDIDRVHGNVFQIGEDTFITFTFSDLQEDSAQGLIIMQNGESSLWKRKKPTDPFEQI